MIRLPRLIRLVRKARESPENVIARAEATQLATDLYLDSLEPWIDQLKEVGFLWETPTLSFEDMSLIPNAFVFKTMRVFRPLLHYWSNRCLICNLVLSLCDIFPPLPSPYELDVAAVTAEGLRAGESIAMCTDYAFATSIPLPVNVLRQQAGLISSFGMWRRSEQSTVSSDDAQRAADMQLWIVRTSDKVCELGLGLPLTKNTLERLHDVYTGGSL